MNKQLMPLMRGNLSSIISSPFPTFIDEFFSDALPFSLIERQDSFPKYNIFRENADVTDEFTVELSLAGYPKEQLKVYTKEGKLVVENDREVEKAERDYLYRGIASRDFTWSMKLPEFSTIKKVTYENGLLKIDVKIEIPEERKAKYIDIE